jgi:hypothetical protein
MRIKTSLILGGLFVVSALATGCNKGPADAPAGNASGEPDPTWKSRIAKAAAAFPKTPLNGCVEPIPKPLILSRATSGGAIDALTFCALYFGKDAAVRDYRPRERDDWRTKAIEGASHIVLFHPTQQRAPVVNGTSLTAGLIEGRAVVFSIDGQPLCENSVSAQGPATASATTGESVDTIAKKHLCQQAEAAVSRSLIQGAQTVPASAPGSVPALVPALVPDSAPALVPGSAPDSATPSAPTP